MTAALLRYLTHPQVQIDPLVPVPKWGLSEVGRKRVAGLVTSGVLASTRTVVSSAERKAIETAEPIAAALGVTLVVREAMHENDRSATGYLPPSEFETMANAFFANPDLSIRGWERAAGAQARIVRETQAVLSSAPEGDVLLVGHGGVGTLLYCHLAGLRIDRRHDQPAGGGNLFAVERVTGKVRHGWRPMEEPDA
jgi:broad specificity phosphatase PhoE